MQGNLGVDIKNLYNWNDSQNEVSWIYVNADETEHLFIYLQFFYYHS